MKNTRILIQGLFDTSGDCTAEAIATLTMRGLAPIDEARFSSMHGATLSVSFRIPGSR